MKKRPGLLKDLAVIFNRAEEMCGSFHPDDMDDERARTKALKRELFSLLRTKRKKKR